ncbi:aminoglycoside phosphotransferase family protein [Nocardiopsis eucommiae]|uniref:aminoglycoside phosphotransferase family protein n=1 Tax=Nocardiopsis eucommiae TaxID=2831970 RepID=UPI003D7517A4
MSTGHQERDQPLSGGMMNTVVRRGERVVRVAPPHAAALHDFLSALTGGGFTGAPRPLALRPAEGDEGPGTEELTFVEGDVALPPFPAWSRADRVVASAARLLRRYHDAAEHVPLRAGTAWPTALSDPEGGTVLCHNDPCLENLVFRGGEAVALIDFDLAAPGRPVWDLAALAFYLGPALPPEALARTEFAGARLPHRLRLIADGYGLCDAERRSLPEALEQYDEVSRDFARDMVDQGSPPFVRSVERAGGWAAWERTKARRGRWLREQRPVLLSALTG